MKEVDIVTAIIELDGWKRDPKSSMLHGFKNQVREFRLYFDFHYLTSYDAIMPLIKKLFPTPSQFQVFLDELKKIVLGISHTRKCPDWFQEEADFALFFATPAQLCEALLRALGKWIE